MKRTNVRINNNYILMNNNNYYLTDIDQLNALEEEDLFQYIEQRPITNKIKELLLEFNFNIDDKVNFIMSEGDFFKLKKDRSEEPLKIIQIKKDNDIPGVKTGGGWGSSKFVDEDKTGGGWGFSKDKEDQTGGGWIFSKDKEE